MFDDIDTTEKAYSQTKLFFHLKILNEQQNKSADLHGITRAQSVSNHLWKQ
jgi:hypothetical protein